VAQGAPSVLVGLVGQPILIMSGETSTALQLELSSNDTSNPLPNLQTATSNVLWLTPPGSSVAVSHAASAISATVVQAIIAPTDFIVAGQWQAQVITTWPSGVVTKSQLFSLNVVQSLA
jgi:hypothetical protein